MLAVLQGRLHQCSVLWDSHLSCLAGDAVFDTHMMGFTLWALMLGLLSPSTPRSLSAGLFSSHSSPSLYLCLALLCPRYRIRLFFFFFSFVPLVPFNAPIYLDASARPLIPQKSQQQIPVWYDQQTY